MNLNKGISDTALDLLEDRIRTLEVKVIGNSYNLECTIDTDIITSLSSLSGKLGNAISTRDRMMMVMKRLDDLERYLDPLYGESHDMTDRTKAELVLSAEEIMCDQYHQLNTLNSKKKCLSFSDVADSLIVQNDQLVTLWQKHEETEKLSKDQNETITEMFENYNSVIMALTDSFTRINDLVTKAEITAAPKKILE